MAWKWLHTVQYNRVVYTVQPVIIYLHYKAIKDLVIISLCSSSPSTSQDHQDGRETPAFVFSMNSGPNTPTFSGFDCNFEVEPSQREVRPKTKLQLEG